MKATEFLLGYSCNNNCVFCSTGGKENDLSFEEVKNKIDELKKTGIELISFTGGEPTIRKDFFKIIKYAKNIGMKVLVDTNGRLFYYKEFCEKSIDSGVDEYIISFLAHNESLYSEITNTKNNFSQTLRGIKNLIEKSQNILVNIVILRQNYLYLSEIVKILTDNRVENLFFVGCCPAGYVLDDLTMIPEMEKSAAEIKKAIDRFKDKINYVIINNYPKCLFKGYERYFKNYEKKGIIGPDFVTPDLEGQKRLDSKKLPECAACSEKNNCMGIWKQYPKKIRVKPYAGIN